MTEQELLQILFALRETFSDDLAQQLMKKLLKNIKIIVL